MVTTSTLTKMSSAAKRSGTSLCRIREALVEFMMTESGECEPSELTLNLRDNLKPGLMDDNRELKQQLVLIMQLFVTNKLQFKSEECYCSL
ncbi:hypothetical protein NPIL_382661 [Nephila pilipes]|uniref:Uncharacterized protein n=1 Tax=Nephila pilipes TaxID=299642 RepID=A0A8X6TTN4_NEPPI|nr:hypothetical protein NPIL_382661 [Nephila pilipes]